MPNLCLHITPAHTAPSWLRTEKLLQPRQDHTCYEVHIKHSDNPGGGVTCQYVLKVGTTTLQLSGIWETLFTGSCPQKCTVLMCLLCLIVGIFISYSACAHFAGNNLCFQGYDKKSWHTAVHFTADKNLAP